MIGSIKYLAIYFSHDNFRLCENYYLKTYVLEMKFRKLTPYDRDSVTDFITQHWGIEYIVVHQDIYYPARFEGYIAEENNEIMGLITYLVKNDCCEIITLNSTIEHKGIGRALMKLVVDEALLNKCKNVWLITTNDNIRAIEFYQKYGFQLTKVYPDAVTASRKIKPEIPLVADNGIPIKDELEFVMELKH